MAFVLNLLKRIAWMKFALLLSIVAALVALVMVGFRYRWWQALERILGMWFWLGLLLLFVGIVIIALFVGSVFGFSRAQVPCTSTNRCLLVACSVNLSATVSAWVRPDRVCGT